MLTFSLTISHELRRSIWEESFPFFPFHGYHAKIAEMPMGFVGSFPTQHNQYLQPSIPRKAVEMDRQLALQENMEAQQELRESLGG